MSVPVCLSVCLSVTEVHWRIIANLCFKFRSKFTAHCRRVDGLSQQHLALCYPLLGPLVYVSWISVNYRSISYRFAIDILVLYRGSVCIIGLLHAILVQ